MYGYGHDEGEGLYGIGLYGMGYRYPKVRREVKSVYSDPAYLKKWAKAALFNTGVASKNPWQAYLREKGVYQEISRLLREASAKYRAEHGVSPSTLKNLNRRIEKMEIIKSQADPYFKELDSEYATKKYAMDYNTAKQRIISRINDELTKLKALEQLALAKK